MGENKRRKGRRREGEEKDAHAQVDTEPQCLMPPRSWTWVSSARLSKHQPPIPDLDKAALEWTFAARKLQTALHAPTSQTAPITTATSAAPPACR